MESYKYLIEFTGVIIILYGKLLTDANPVVMGILYFAVFTLAQNITTGFFNPLGAIAMYAFGRATLRDMIYNIGAQLLGGIATILTFSPIKVFIHDLE